MIRYQQGFISDNAPFVLWQVTDGNDQKLDSICNWLVEHRDQIDNLINRSGALLIRGLNQLQNAVDFEAAMQIINPSLRDYIGGTSPREQVHGKIMTATYVPPTWSIPLHQEMAYTNNPPDRIAFFCQEAAGYGGDSTLGDMPRITLQIDDAIKQKFIKHGIQLRRTLPSAHDLSKKPGVKKPWNEVFATDDKKEVERIVYEKGWRCNWLNEDSLHLWQDILPAIKKHPVTHENVWFNQAHFFAPICMMAWAERDKRTEDYEQLAQAKRKNPEMLDTVFYGNGEEVEDEVARYLAELLAKNETVIKLQAHDFLILDNTLVAHGRHAFQGQRNIFVALANVPNFHREQA